MWGGGVEGAGVAFTTTHIMTENKCKVLKSDLDFIAKIKNTQMKNYLKLSKPNKACPESFKWPNGSPKFMVMWDSKV